MSHILNLPEEILIIIIKNLDIKSQINLYQTCQQMQNIILMHGVIRVCDLSFNPLSTAKSLQLEMIKFISCHLFELNMSAVSDLTASALILGVKKMKSLKKLNVSDTKITIEDVIGIYKVCPTIKSLKIDYMFKDPMKFFNEFKTFQKCQEIFKSFDDVHLVMKVHVYGMPSLILKGSFFNNLTFTLCDWRCAEYLLDVTTICQYDRLRIFILAFYTAFSDITISSCSEFLPVCRTKDVEFMVIHYDFKYYSFWVSPLIKKFLTDKFYIAEMEFVKINTFAPEDLILGNVGIYIWKKETTKFDESFFCNLKRIIQDSFVYKLSVSDEEILPLGPSSKDYKMFHITQYPIHLVEDTKSGNTEPNFKKKRVVLKSQVLNYDKVFCEYNTVKLRVYFPDAMIASLSAGSEYLRKLTHLSFEGDTVRFTNDFFNILFRSCENLTTLNVEASSVQPTCPAIARSIPLSKSIKNIRLIDKRIDFTTLFSSFSQCVTLENIYAIDTSWDMLHFPDPSPMFNKCTSLYNLYIEANLSESKIKKISAMLSIAKKKCSMDHLNIRVKMTNKRSYDPFLHVFYLIPIKPV